MDVIHACVIHACVMVDTDDPLCVGAESHAVDRVFVLAPSYLAPVVRCEDPQQVLARYGEPAIIAAESNLGGGRIAFGSADFDCTHLAPIARIPYVDKAIGSRRRDVAAVRTGRDREDLGLVLQPSELGPG